MKRYLSLVLIVLCSMAFLCACSKKAESSSVVYKYLGDYEYSAPAVCMVYEPVEDETDDEGNPYYGIQYREINDLDGLLSSGETILIYFYSSMSNDSAMITASVEDIAQVYNGTMTVLMLDAMEYRDLIGKYDINAVPEFVLIRAGQEDKVFGSSSYEYWNTGDVLSWLKSNGIA